ncbi:DsbC family protein [Halomonas sp. FeN2]|jgi:thiol:disulfide interchange protein DsbC|uniref:Thiol:disulfide interchange protein n=1 Tax=Vreelandella neptunia TaxID=115551 RepID=A0ABZ0YPW3_9GAMM|nr:MULTISPECIES: DsbC family protein [Halomonas]TDV98684.1 thiol:disulfide interchange protein DsbC [Halomonas alkaliantarctica]MBF58557.1 protein-disulfide isomerase [Halomonas sp.]MBL1270510.1 DsbC family protein [Halomonas sp.]MDN3558317.1 DsbC family protein [Halomonas neptunia]UBR48471.1 DsbC family protein [Halomonas sp. FeN2]|tara:strand:- start:170 stop:973 length:804 start_codon:yes stop_codon:yes gene_type:complete
MLNITQEAELMMRQRRFVALPLLTTSSMLACLLTASLLSSAAQADDVGDRLAESLSVNGQSMPVKAVTETPMDGVYHVRLESGESFYSNADGSHFLVGDLYENAPDGLVNLTEQEQNQERADALAAVPESELVIFRGADEPKATITVFTDPTCPYCARLHDTIPELNERGIAVHYMAFPRAGMASQAATTLQQVWCSDNRSEAMTQAKEGKSISSAADCDNPVAGQYDLGKALGVQGTPAIILPNGQLVPGFVPPERLSAMLGLENG